MRFTRGSGKPCTITPGAEGSPLATECTSVVAPPGSTTSNGPRPEIPSQPSASIRAPSSTAAGVGISTRSNSACARSIPLACTMRSMNTWRIAARAGSMWSTLNSGITFSVASTSLPASAARASSAALRLPASTTVHASALRPSTSALCRMTSLLPPSVPPASSRMSGASATMRSTSLSVSRYANAPTSFAPAPSAARRAASAVSSRTSPTVTMRNPPAALLEASRYLKRGKPPRRRSRSARLAFMPIMMSVVTVDGPWPEPRMRRRSRSIARSFVYVLPKSINSAAVVIASPVRVARLRLREVLGEPRENRFDARSRRRRAVESHVEKPFLDLGPRLLADDEIAADVEEDGRRALLRCTGRGTRGNRARPGRRATTRESRRRLSRWPP